jgi:uncharacterized small protein (DUF1192 family)
METLLLEIQSEAKLKEQEEQMVQLLHNEILNLESQLRDKQADRAKAEADF